MATHYAGNARVAFGLMNEPHTMPTELWLADANEAIDAIRDSGAPNLILVVVPILIALFSRRVPAAIPSEAAARAAAQAEHA